MEHRGTKVARMSPKRGAEGGLDEVNSRHRKTARCEGEERMKKSSNLYTGESCNC